MDCDARARLPSNVAGVAKALVHEAILAVEGIYTTIVEDEGELNPWNIARNPAA